MQDRNCLKILFFNVGCVHSKVCIVLYFLGICLTDLPEEIIIYILQFIPETELLFSVRKVNQRLCEIIDNSNVIVDVIFDDCYILDEELLTAITKHASHIKSFQIAFQEIVMDNFKFNNLLSSLAYAELLTTLDLSVCPVSDISFVPYLTSLVCLNLSSTNIDDSQLKYICLPKLTYLYRSFNNISIYAVLDTLTILGIKYLDINGIPCTYEQFLKAILFCPTICGIHATFQTVEDNENAIQQIWQIKLYCTVYDL